jgi:leucine efflux protein
MIFGITDLTTFVLGTIFIVLLPGPNSLYVMAIASRFGVGAGYRGACGIFLGDLILMVLAASGAASLLKTTPALFLIVKYAGAAYLAWLGIGLFRAAITTWRQAQSSAHHTCDPQALPESAGGGGMRPDGGASVRPFRTALFISLMNPKAILFFVSFFIQFVDPGYAYPELSFLILGAIVQICSALYLSLLIFGGAHLSRNFRRHHRFSATAIGGVGALFIGFGVKLFGASLAN